MFIAMPGFEMNVEQVEYKVIPRDILIYVEESGKAHLFIHALFLAAYLIKKRVCGTSNSYSGKAMKNVIGH